MAISGLTHTQNHYHAFLNKKYPSRRKPLPPGVVETPKKLMLKRSPYNLEQLCLLLRREPMIRTPGNLERSWTLSLSLKSDFPSIAEFHPLERRENILFSFHLFSFCPHCHMSTLHWLIGLHLIIFIHLLWISIQLGDATCPRGGPLGSPCLTNSAPDTWHIVSHSKCAKCPALPLLPRKT